MSNIQFILTIAVCAAATMLTRFLPFLVFGSRGGKVPEVVEYLGHVLPAAIFGMLIVYQIRRSVFSGSDLLNFIFQFILVGNLDIQFFLIILVGKTHEIVVAVLVFQSA